MTGAGVRVARLTDAAAIAAIYEPYVRETAISFEIDPPDAAEFGRRIAAGLRNYPWLVCEMDDRVVGYAYASPHRERSAYAWSVDVTVYLGQDVHRRGCGRMLYRALLELLRGQGFARAFGGIALPNAPSVGLHEAMGFAPIGVYQRVGYKLDAWRDVGWWGCDLAEPGPRPAPPRPFDPVTATAVLQQL